MIEYISVENLWPHPDNPRKDLGDLSELADSIKANGILQNLTVVPLVGSVTGEIIEGRYRVVIGHRRLAAAELAGLKEVPCIITEMTQKEQIATMLLENMQRSDLTVYEQAQGFQQLMLFGDSVSKVAEKTGFSETTVRRRVKLLELDQGKFKESIGRGATLQDYAELEKIKGMDLRNSVLEHIGTRDFDWKLKSAIEKQERPERKKALLKVLDEFAKKIKKTEEIKGGLTYERYFNSYHMDNWEKPKDADTAEYYYMADNDSASLYKKIPKADKKELSPKEKDFNRREAECKKLSKRAYELRHEFVQNFSAGKKYAKEICEFVFQNLQKYRYPDHDEIFKFLSIEAPDTENMDYGKIQESRRDLLIAEYKKAPECALLKVAYAGLNDGPGKNYFEVRRWESEISHQGNEDLNTLYDTLISMGYEMSNEEKQLQDGTHELFMEEE